MIEIILSICYVTYDKRQHLDLMLAAVSVLNLCIVHDLNSLEAYTSCTVHEQDSVVVRHKRRNCTRTIAHMLYSM